MSMSWWKEVLRSVTTELVNKLKIRKGESKDSHQESYDPEKNKLQWLASSVQKEIEDTSPLFTHKNPNQRSERWSLKIMGKGWEYKLGSYGKTTSIKKMWSDYKVLEQLFDKPEEAIKYANMFNFMKNEVVKNWGLKDTWSMKAYINWVEQSNKSTLLKYGNWLAVKIVYNSAMPNSKNDEDGIFDDMKSENILQKNLTRSLIIFAKKNNLVVS